MAQKFLVPLTLVSRTANPASATEGTLYYNSSEDQVKFYTGTQWLGLGLQGVTGSQGTIGSTGTQGTIGSQGLTGTTGSQGTSGINGSQGATGTTGLQGLTGSQGLTGTGTQGTTGLQGIQGILGTGVQGTAGANGNAYIVDYLDGGDSSITPDIIYNAGVSTTNSWTYTIDASGATVSF